MSKLYRALSFRVNYFCHSYLSLISCSIVRKFVREFLFNKVYHMPNLLNL